MIHTARRWYKPLSSRVMGGEPGFPGVATECWGHSVLSGPYAIQTCAGCAEVSFPHKTFPVPGLNPPYQTLQLQDTEDWIGVGWDPRSERQYGNIWKSVVQHERAQDTTYLMVSSLIKTLHHLLCDGSLTGSPSFQWYKCVTGCVLCTIVSLFDGWR